MITLQQLIRYAMVGAIHETTGYVAYLSPRTDLGVSLLPAICIYSHGDKATNEDSDSTRPHPRIYSVAVDYTGVGRSAEDSTDAMARLIRKALLSDSTQGGLAALTTWSTQEWGGTEGEVPLSGTVMIFSFLYMWRPEW